MPLQRVQGDPRKFMHDLTDLYNVHHSNLSFCCCQVYHQSICVTFRDSTLNTANLCLAISVVGLFYLLTVIMNFVCWFIFRRRFH